MPSHRSQPLVERGLLVKKQIQNPMLDSHCCLAWNEASLTPAISWLLNYLGDSEKLHSSWLK